MDLAPAAAITSMAKEKVQASVTVITKEQIAMTPARDIYDLLEVYVPGANWMVHNEDPHVGIRGINSDRSTKLLILINGRKVNEDTVSGAIAELEMWDLNDIERVEIVRGPGSVTYGPGAIEGVINVVTKNAETDPGVRAGYQYVDKYNSNMMYFSDGIKTKKIGFYLYGSLTSTKGDTAKTFSVTGPTTYGYIGQGSYKGLEPNDYFSDSQGKPQGKFYTELDFLNECKAWGRFINWGSARYSDGSATAPSEWKTVITSTGDLTQVRENTDALGIAAIEDNHKFSDSLSLDSSFSWSDENHEKRSLYLTANAAANFDADNPLNMVNDFSEREYLLKTIAKYDLLDKYKFAVGGEFSDKQIAPAWGKSLDDFRPEAKLYGSVAGAIAHGQKTTDVVGKDYWVTDAWSDTRVSYLGEADLEFHKLCTIILSGRSDHSNYAGWAFSPRIAYVADFGNSGILKYVWQKSIRFNTEGYLRINHLNGTKPITEETKDNEIIYEVSPSDKVTVTNSLFYTSLDAVAWNSTIANTASVGTLKLFGEEIEVKYKGEKSVLGASYSLTKQQSFKLADGQFISGISYSDVNNVSTNTTMLFAGNGNDLNNWPNDALKIYDDYNLTPKITIHGDIKVFWDYKGALDGLAMDQGAIKTVATQAQEAPIFAMIRGKNAYKTSMTGNLSTRFNLTEKWSTTIFAMNLVGIHGNKRYGYDSGYKSSDGTYTFPSKIYWVEEPTVWGIKAEYKF